MSSLLSQTKSILRQHGLHPSKRLGQSFLVDANILDKILQAADITPEDTVLEIGPGTGVLTEALLTAADKVIAVEYDKGLYGYLKQRYQDNPKLVLVHGDYLKVDLAELVGARCNVPLLKIVSNLPYYISTPLLFKLIDERRFFEYAVLMLQKEVVARMTASPGTKDYGALTLNAALYSQVEPVAPVSRNCFYPAPEVDSALIKLTFLERSAVELKDEELFHRIVKAAFAQRRKTLYNALVGAALVAAPDKGQASRLAGPLQEALEAAGIDGKRRGETLSLEEFALLANTICQLNP
jgi:16S rRNA (adenine1518-N6/adenine1519-N6)-dimethyltransferase